MLNFSSYTSGRKSVAMDGSLPYLANRLCGTHDDDGPGSEGSEGLEGSGAASGSVTRSA